MRITTKFIGSSALLMALSASLFVSSYAINQRVRKSLGKMLAQVEVTVETVIVLDVAVEDQVTALNRLAVLTNDSDEIKAYNQARESFFQALDTLESQTTADDQVFRLQLEGIRRKHTYIEKIAKDLISPKEIAQENAGSPLEQASELSSERTEAQTQEIIRSLKLFEHDVKGPIKSVRTYAKRQATAYQLQEEAFHEQLVWLQLLGFSSVMVMFLAQFYGLLRPVTKAIQRLQAGTEHLGLETISEVEKIQLTTGDELQALADSFNQMSDRLRASYQNLESRVAERTASLYQANQSLLAEVSDRLETEASLKQALAKLKQTQLQLLQTEKMSSLGQLVAGVAHEINNPISFIQGNLEPAQAYMTSLLTVIKSYQAEWPEVSDEFQAKLEQADLAFIESDFPRLLGSMNTGTERIAQIVQSLKTFSHLDESETKSVDIHEGIDSATFLINAQLGATAHRPAIQLIRQYANLPQVYCYPSQLNQVFMGILSNSIDALSPCLTAATEGYRPVAKPTITITTDQFSRQNANYVRIRFTDNGIGMSEETCRHIFDPFYTTKPVGSGMGLGLSMSYQIMVVNHQGKLTCKSQVGVGSTFTLEIPLDLKARLQISEPLATVATLPGLLTL
jgi:signal transduction histidine kinase